MTLVVAALSPDEVVMVADTMITFRDSPPDPNQHPVSRLLDPKVYQDSLPKIVLLDGGLAVGYAGADPVSQLRRLTGLRGASREVVLAVLETFHEAEFVVLSVEDGPRLWQVRDQKAVEYTLSCITWAGDEAAWATFWENWQGMSEISQDLPFLAQSSLQSLRMKALHPTVGGFLTRIAHTSDGFRYLANPEMVVASYPPLQIVNFVGTGDTFGALGYLLLPAGWGIVFRHAQPWDPIVIRAATAEQFIEIALAEHGENLVGGHDGA